MYLQPFSTKSIAGAVVAVFAVVSACSTGPGSVAEPGLVTGSVESGQFLTVGECIDEIPQAPSGPESPFNGALAGDQHSARCDQPHSDEVFAVLSLSRFPNIPTDSGELVTGCRAQLRKYSPSVSQDPNVRIVLVPPGTNWKYMGDHTAACLAHFTPNRVGSIKG
jgi:hypothetical protein